MMKKQNLRLIVLWRKNELTLTHFSYLPVQRSTLLWVVAALQSMKS